VAPSPIATDLLMPPAGRRRVYVEKCFGRTPTKTGIPKKLTLHERVNAMKRRRRRLPFRDRLRSRRRLVELGLKKGK
jgi:hypothetical protein